MDDFPEFMKRQANRIAASSQATAGVEGYVFDRADGSQMAFWTVRSPPSMPAKVARFGSRSLVPHARSEYLRNLPRLAAPATRRT